MTLTTPRRSRRGQPIVSKDLQSSKSSDSAYNLPGQPIHVRPTVAADVPDETSIMDSTLSSYETHFYSSFQRAGPFIKRPAKVYGKRGAKPEQDNAASETYSVGDTVLVKTEARQPAKDREPSIAVISAIWTLWNTDAAESGSPPLQVRIHWFARPSELAKERAHHEHGQNEIYYSVASSVTIPPSAILEKCTVTVSGEQQGPRPSLKKEVNRDTDRNSFYCTLAADLRRGIFYEFAWDHFRASALNALAEDSTSDDCWNVPIDEEEGLGGKKRSPVEKDRAHVERVPSDKPLTVHDNPSGSATELQMEVDTLVVEKTPRKTKRGRAKSSRSRATRKLEELDERVDLKTFDDAHQSEGHIDEFPSSDDELLLTPSHKNKRTTVTDTRAGPSTVRKRQAKPVFDAPHVQEDEDELALNASTDDLSANIHAALPLRNQDELNPEPKTPSRKRKREIVTPSTDRVLRSSRGTNKRHTVRYDIDSGESIADSDAADDSEFEGSPSVTHSDVSEDEKSLVDAEDFEPKTPSRRQRAKYTSPRKAATTPRSRRTVATPTKPRRALALAKPTPHSKAALRRRRSTALAVRPPPTVEIGALELNWGSSIEAQDPWLRAMHVLHVAARPEALPCREEEYGRVLRAVEELLEEGSGGCVYISGQPGTGKTATVHAVVRELKRMAQQNEANPFSYVEINGLRIPEPNAAYGLLWEAVSGHDTAREGHLKISAPQALRLLSRHFSSGGRAGPGGHACVVLMDELDQLMTTKQDVVYNFFNWPTLVGSRLVVIAVANTMDLPERVMTGRVRSRLGMTRINFHPYATPQLEKIVHARLQAAKNGLSGDDKDVIANDAIKFASMKVSSVTGDARRVLDICRRTVELVQPLARTARTEDVKEVIKEMQNSPTAAFLRDLSFHERLMLAAMLKCIKKEGVDQIRWGDLHHQHIVYMNLLAGEDDPERRPGDGELKLILRSLSASHAIICEDGAAVARKAEDDRRVALNLEYSEVARVLAEVGGTRWKNTLSM